MKHAQSRNRFANRASLKSRVSGYGRFGFFVDESICGGFYNLPVFDNGEGKSDKISFLDCCLDEFVNLIGPNIRARQQQTHTEGTKKLEHEPYDQIAA
jgi:hypothetical protein